jgi:hypothetical protein
LGDCFARRRPVKAAETSEGAVRFYELLVAELSLAGDAMAILRKSGWT